MAFVCGVCVRCLRGICVSVWFLCGVCEVQCW